MSPVTATDEVPAAEVIAAGGPADYEERDLIKARNKIKHLVCSRKDGMKGDWVWPLTDHLDNYPHRPSRDSAVTKCDKCGEPAEHDLNGGRVCTDCLLAANDKEIPE